MIKAILKKGKISKEELSQQIKHPLVVPLMILLAVSLTILGHMVLLHIFS